MDYGLLIAAGKSGSAAVRPHIGHELQHFYLDFLSYNTFGTTVSILRFIIQSVELAWLSSEAPKGSSVDQAIIFSVITASFIVTLCLIVLQCAAVSLDLVKWTHRLVERKFCVHMTIRRSQYSISLRTPEIRFARLHQSLSQSLPVLPVLTAQTSICSTVTPCNGTDFIAD